MATTTIKISSKSMMYRYHGIDEKRAWITCEMIYSTAVATTLIMANLTKALSQ